MIGASLVSSVPEKIINLDAIPTFFESLTALDGSDNRGSLDFQIIIKETLLCRNYQKGLRGL